MEILGLIPARRNSVRIKNKNTQDLGGKPLIQWTFDAIKESNITKTIVCTDDPTVVALASKNNLGFLHQPAPFCNGTEHVSKLCLWILDYLLEEQSYSPKGIFLLFPTSPFRTKDHINKAIELFERADASENEICSVIGVKKSRPIECLRYTIDGCLMPYVSFHKLNVQSQDADETFLVNGAIFIAGPGELRFYRSFHVPQSRPLLMDQKSSIEIDDLEDLELARSLL